VRLISSAITPARINRLAVVDPSFARELTDAHPSFVEMMAPRIADELGLRSTNDPDSLSQLVHSPKTRELLRNEVSLLSLALSVLKAQRSTPEEGTILPADVTVVLTGNAQRFREVESVRLRLRPALGGTLYDPPSWCPPADRWRFSLGYLLRFVLTGREDFSDTVRPASWREDGQNYRSATSHWFQRIYSLFSGHAAFGDDWLPISEWTETLLFSLLSWPGCELSGVGEELISSPASAQDHIEGRLQALASIRGGSVDLIPLDLDPSISLEQQRPLRACIVQSVVPLEKTDFNALDVSFSLPAVRTRHRRHLSAALAAVDRMLALRETHKGRDGRLDILILPELAVHPDDVKSHLVPFARSHKTIILTGLTYEHLTSGTPAVNSALWIIPTRSKVRGLQVLIRRQGKANLAPNETTGTMAGLLRGFRPCQWLIGYRWSNDVADRPLWLSASICYDATDIQLAADLKSQSDVFIVPALNQDISTFDQMALALHYHMFQMVIIANSGRYGGSNAYAPFRQAWERQIFHVHGQPQATISFFELDDIASFINRYSVTPKPSGPSLPDYQFKAPPAPSS
jgi:hypothetical protein